MPDALPPPGPPKRAPQARDPRATQQGILDAAFIEFTDHGLSGARVDAIAARTGTNVRMIYYYFGSKDGLYCAVLEQAYTAMRLTERTLNLEALSPADAIRRLVEFTFDYQESNPRLSRLVTIENIHRAEHIARSETIQALNATIIATIATIAAVLARGQRDGAFRPDATPVGLHLLMTSFSFFRVANRHTLGAIFQQDPLDPALRDGHRRMIVEAVLGYLQHGR